MPIKLTANRVDSIRLGSAHYLRKMTEPQFVVIYISFLCVGGEPYIRAARVLMMEENWATVRKVYSKLCQIVTHA